MSISINTNVSSLTASRQLAKSTSNLGKTFERLSSGLRVNSAKDDTAGLAIGTRMTSQIRGTNMAIRNSNDAISMLQVAEGALNETTNALQRMRELAIQANSDTMTNSDRSDLQLEVTQLMAEVQRISVTTEFNDQKLLNGSFHGTTAGTSMFIQIGADVGQTIKLEFGSNRGVNASGLGLSTSTGGARLHIGSGTFSTASIGLMINRIDNALGSVSDIRSKLGAYQNRFESVIANLSNMSENTSAARSRIMDADIAAETASLTKNSIMQQAGTAILAQANQQPQIALQLLG